MPRTSAGLTSVILGLGPRSWGTTPCACGINTSRRCALGRWRGIHGASGLGSWSGAPWGRWRARRRPMAYLIEHTAACDCQDREDPVCQTPHDVAVYLWGRDVHAHVVYQGECPYRL